jgi:hypothetical protein
LICLPLLDGSMRRSCAVGVLFSVRVVAIATRTTLSRLRACRPHRCPSGASSPRHRLRGWQQAGVRRAPRPCIALRSSVARGKSMGRNRGVSIEFAMFAASHSRRSFRVSAMGDLPLTTDMRTNARMVRYGPCVDGFGLARRIFTLQRWSERPSVRPVRAVPHDRWP